MTDKFRRCFLNVLKNEGGYAHIAGDRGGRTWYGISERAQPLYFARIIAAPDDATRIEIAGECYEKEYWGPMICEQLPDALAFRLFDAAVVAGCYTATLCLQRALVLAGAQIAVDGRMGPITLGAAQRLARGYERNLVGWTTWYLGQHFQDVGENDGQRRFLWGWGARLVEP